MSRKPKYDLVAVGGATWDAVVTGADTKLVTQRGRKYLAYPYGEKVHLQNAYFGYGGGGANVAVSASRLGLRTAYLGSIGDDHVGQDILAHFKREHVDTSMVEQDPDRSSALSTVLTAPDGERTILLHDGSNRDLGIQRLPWRRLMDTRWLYLPSLPGRADALYNRLAGEAQREDVRLALNPGAYQIKRGLRGLQPALAACDVLFLNESEARELLTQRGHATRTVAAMLLILAGIATGIVVITRGDRGAVATDGKTIYNLPALKSRRVNTVGSGDAFGSTLVVALSKGKSLADAMVLASLNASAVVADYTAQSGLLSWRELSRRFRTTRGYRPKVSKLPTR